MPAAEPAADSFRTADGLHLYARHWAPPHPRGVVLVVHGYAEHSGRYEALAAALNARGLAVSAFDLRGHGLSQGRRVYVPHFAAYVDDLARFVGVVRARYPALPLFLLGHSVGGAVALHFALDHPTAPVAGLVLSSPALRYPDTTAPFLRRAARCMSRLAPRLPTIVPFPPTALTADAAELARVEADPLYYRGRLPARTGAELDAVTHRLPARYDALRLPLLVFHGTADPITDPAGSAALYRAAAGPDKTLRLFPGLLHETMHETEREAVFTLVAEWIAARLPEAAPAQSGAPTS